MKVIIYLSILIKNIFSSLVTTFWALFALLILNNMLVAFELDPFLNFSTWSSLVWKVYLPVMIIVQTFFDIKEANK